ncbi:DsbA family protein [Patescibacteria group bacterium]|nr:DsbA family protein [Patescibacteria group bacterium]
MSSFYHKKWYRKWWGILIIIFSILIIITIISSAIYFFNTKKAIESGELQINPETGEVFNPQELREGTSNYYLGTDNPELTIVMFSDLNCPYCKKAFEVITGKDGILREYPNKLKLVYRDLPVIDSDSIVLSEAARCAGEQGKFWLMVDELFKRQGDFELNKLPDIAESTGANKIQFAACIAEDRYLNAIRKDMKDAGTLDIERTPTYLIDEYVMPGHMEKDQFKIIIEQLLEEK